MTSLVRRWIFVLGLVLMVLVFFKDTVWRGALPVPSDALVGLYHPFRDALAGQYPRGVPFKNFLITDPVRQQIPWRRLAVEQWKSGYIPWWNPSAFAGMPLAANIQAAVFYPLNIVFFVLPFMWGWTVLIILQPLLAAVLMYFYLRSRGYTNASSFTAGFVWALCGFHVAWLTWGTINHVTLWIPLGLWCIDRIKLSDWQRGSLLASVLLGVICSLQILAGHIQMALYAMGLYGLYALFAPPAETRTNWRRRNLLAGLIVTSSVIAVGTGIQLIPLTQLLQDASRIGQLGNWLREGWFLPWEHLVQFLIPDFFGNPATLNYWGKWNYGEFIGYIGVIPFVFALNGVAAIRKQRTVLFWTAITVLALALMLPWKGAEWPFVLQVPVLAVLQPTRIMSVVSLALVMLFAYGFDTWLKHKRIAPGAVVLAGALFFGIWLYVMGALKQASGETVARFMVTRRNMILPTFLFGSVLLTVVMTWFSRKHTRLFGITVLAVIGLIAGDLLRMGWKFTPFTPRAYFFPETAALQFLRSQTPPFRIMTTDDRMLAPNVSVYYGLESLDGYDPLYGGRYERFIAAMEKNSPEVQPPYGFNRIITPRNIASHLLPLLNVRYVLSLNDINRSGFTEVFREGETKIYQVETLPRVYLADAVIEVPSEDEALRGLFSVTDLGRTAFVEGVVAPLNLAAGTTDRVELTLYAASELRFRTTTLTDRFVVISQLHHPLWSATIDGLSTPVFRTNYLFMGVVIPPGEHEVVLTMYNSLF